MRRWYGLTMLLLLLLGSCAPALAPRLTDAQAISQVVTRLGPQAQVADQIRSGAAARYAAGTWTITLPPPANETGIREPAEWLVTDVTGETAARNDAARAWEFRSHGRPVSPTGGPLP
jgi:hypothetical protein